MRFVPADIPRPDYAYSGYPASEMQRQSDRTIEVKSPQDIENLRQACVIGKEGIWVLLSFVRKKGS